MILTSNGSREYLDIIVSLTRAMGYTVFEKQLQ
jgi:hypothetical protein